MARRAHVLKIRLSDEELAEFIRRCPDGTTRSHWLRQLGLGQPVVRHRRRQPPPTVDANLLLEVRRIGVNLNQLARSLNLARWKGGVSALHITRAEFSLQACQNNLAALLERASIFAAAKSQTKDDS